MELLTVGQVLNMKASFRDVNEALQRSITVLRSKKNGNIIPKMTRSDFYRGQDNVD